MEKDNSITISTILNYYTEGFEIGLISHVISIMNEGRNFKSYFEYSFKVGSQNVSVSFDDKNNCLTAVINNGIDSLTIKRHSSLIEIIRNTNDGVFKATLTTVNGKTSIETTEITDSYKLELK